MASSLTSQVVIKDEMFEDWNVLLQYNLLDSSGGGIDTFEEDKPLSFNVTKKDEAITDDPIPEPFFLNTSRFPHDLPLMKKLLQLTLPKKHVCSKWTKQTTESILRFLKSFVTIAQGSRLSHCADKCVALKGPRILKCEECLLEFTGLYDRYLKLFIHYKRDHRLKCNMLIGRKWMKQKASLNIMVQLWRMDIKYELQNISSPCVDKSLVLRSLESSRRRNIAHLGEQWQGSFL